jgi:hypothetical protein
LAEESIAQAAKGMEKNLKAAMGDGSQLNEAFQASGPNHPLSIKLKDLISQNELEKSSLEVLQEKIRVYEKSFEELKVSVLTGYIGGPSIAC